MACRIGITTNPGERKRYWEGQHRNLRNWTILSRHRTKTAAQAAETLEARRRRCQASPGGAGPEQGNWAVYYFEY